MLVKYYLRQFRIPRKNLIMQIVLNKIHRLISNNLGLNLQYMEVMGQQLQENKSIEHINNLKTRKYWNKKTNKLKIECYYLLDICMILIRMLSKNLVIIINIVYFIFKNVLEILNKTNYWDRIKQDKIFWTLKININILPFQIKSLISTMRINYSNQILIKYLLIKIIISEVLPISV